MENKTIIQIHEEQRKEGELFSKDVRDTLEGMKRLEDNVAEITGHCMVNERCVGLFAVRILRLARQKAKERRDAEKIPQK